MAISSKMRRVGESVYYKEFLKPQLNEIVGENSYKMEHIVGRRKLVTHTDRVDDTILATVSDLLTRVLPQNIEVALYNHNMDISWRDIIVYVPPAEVNKYDNCTDISAVKEVNADYKSDLLNGGWGYPLTALQLAQSSDGWQNYGLFYNSGMSDFGIPILPNLIKARGMFYSCKNLEKMKLSMPKVLQIGAHWEVNTNSPLGFLQNCPKLKYAELYIPECIGAVGAFMGDSKLERVCLTDSGKLVYATEICNKCDSLTSFSWTAKDVHTATRGWNECKLDKTSALNIVSALATNPTRNQAGEAAGLITLGLSAELQTDDEVLEAIVDTEAKGWTLTVQWNGTPTAQASATYGLRKPSIYAKLVEIELSDGTIERVLDWGHYVTNPEDYQEFSSLEEAREYFGISEDIEELNNSEQ